MLGVHSHSENVHTRLELFLNFLVIFGAQLVFRLLELQPKLPCLTDIYYSVLYSLAVTFSFYGINKLRENSTPPTPEPSP